MGVHEWIYCCREVWTPNPSTSPPWRAELRLLGADAVLMPRDTALERTKAEDAPEHPGHRRGHGRLFKVTVRTRLPALLPLLAPSEPSLRRDTCDKQRAGTAAVSPREGSVPGVTLRGGGHTHSRTRHPGDRSMLLPPPVPDPGVTATGTGGTWGDGGRSPAMGTAGCSGARR